MPVEARDDTVDAFVGVEQFERAALVGDVDTVALGDGVERVDEAGTAAPCLDRETAPELEPAIDFEGLPSVDRHEADALAAHPGHRVEAARAESRGDSRRGATFRDAAEAVGELVSG